MTTIATAAEEAVRADYRAGIVTQGIDAYEAAQVELSIRAEDAGINLTTLVLKDTASKIAARATA